jgi:hypothetical protein
MAPAWLTAVAWIYLGLCFCCAGLVGYDIVVHNRRQPMAVMNFVFPITALYFGPLALWFYLRWGRAARPVPQASPEVRVPAEAVPAHAGQAANADAGGLPPPAAPPPAGHPAAGHPAADGGRPWWVTMATEVSHCGAGCTLGDVISEFLIFALALTIAGATLPAEYAGDYLLALAFGIAFQYFAIAPMRGLGVRDGLIAATKADFISLTAFEVGLFGWMAVMMLVLFPAPHQLMPNSAAFWLLMQVGMMIGFATSWPANAWLVRRGIKVPM